MNKYPLRQTREIVGIAKVPPMANNVYLPATEVAFGSMTNAVTGSSAFIYTVGSSTVDIFGSGGTFEASPGNLKIYSGSNASNITPTTIEISGSSNTGTFTDANITFGTSSSNSLHSSTQSQIYTATNSSNITSTTVTVSGSTSVSTLIAGSLTLNQPNSNVMQFLPGDLGALTSTTCKMLQYQVCDPSSGTIKLAYLFSSPPV